MLLRLLLCAMLLRACLLLLCMLCCFAIDINNATQLILTAGARGLTP